MDLGEILLGLNVAAYTIYAPYTKVEESFNLQACHDILTYGFAPSDLWQWDHNEFPGAVPRSFLGAIILATMSYVPLKLLALVQSPSGLTQQIVVRLVLGSINAASLIFLYRQVKKTFGHVTAHYYLALQGTQFHVMYYASRTLPNFFAFPLTNMALGLLITTRPYHALCLLTVATITLRSEIMLLLGTFTAYHLFVTRYLAFFESIRIGLASGTVSFLSSAVVDSLLWRRAVVPEVSGFIFNIIHGNASQWGVSPWYQYFADLVKLLLNPLALPLVGYGMYVDPRIKHLTIPCLSFVSIFSFQPHKEWRFIVYIVPALSLAAATGAAYLHTHRSKGNIYKGLTVLVLCSIAGTGLLSHAMGLVSAMNYPGGEMMQRIPATNGSVYLDVATCMTGSTNFLRSGVGTFVRTENSTKLMSETFWDDLKYASVSEPGVIKSSHDNWQEVDRVYAFAGINLRGGHIKKAAKLILMENLHDELP